MPASSPAADTRTSRSLPLALALLLCAPIAQASDPNAHDVALAVVEGDAVTGVGAVTGIDNLVVNSHGDYTVEVDTDNADTTADGALVGKAGVVLREGDFVAVPFGAKVGSFDAVTLNDDGAGGYNLFLDDTGSTSDDSAVYLGGGLILREGNVSTATGFTAGTPYRGFFEVKINESEEFLVMASVDDPAIPSTTDRALVIATTTPAGLLATETVVAKEGDLLPGQSEVVDDFLTGPHSFAFNDAGQVMFVANLAGDTATDHAVYVDGTLVAQEGSASPAPGTEWTNLSGAEVDMNNHGDWIVSGNISGPIPTSLLIAVNGVTHAQSGHGLPAIAPFTFMNFGSGPLHIADNGTTLWFGDWDDPDTTRDTGLFLNDQLVVQEGVTVVDGSTVMLLRGSQDGYDLSDDGTWMIFEAVLADGREGAFLIEIGSWTSLGKGLAGTGGVTPCLTGLGPMGILTANSLQFADAPASAFCAVFVGATRIDAPFSFGTLVPSPTVIRFFTTDAGGGLTLPFVVPASVPVGFPLFVQGWFEDAGAPGGYSASNGVKAITVP